MEMKLKQNMSAHPVTVRFKDDLASAYIRMKRDGFRHMPVIDDMGKVVGIISDRDFQRAMWPESSSAANVIPDTPQFRKDAKVSEYMSWPLRTLNEDVGLQTAVEIMIEEKISAIVVTRKDAMVGILTHEDLLKVLATILKNPNSIREKVENIGYLTPLGRVSEMLAAAGI